MAPIDQHGSTTQVDLNSTTSPRQPGGNNMSLQLWSFALTSYNFPPGSTSNQSASGIDSQSATPKTVSTTKENLKVAGRFIQTLMTKLPEIVDTNPAKMALSLAKVIIEIKKVRHHSLPRSLTDDRPRVLKQTWMLWNEGLHLRENSWIRWRTHWMVGVRTVRKKGDALSG